MDQIFRRRRTDYELVSERRSRYDSVECPSDMPACAPDPLRCVFCDHLWTSHGPARKELEAAGCRHHDWLPSWGTSGRCFCPRTAPGVDPPGLSFDVDLLKSHAPRVSDNPLPALPLPGYPRVPWEADVREED